MRDKRNARWIAAACVVALSACQIEEIVVIDREYDFYDFPPAPSSDNCVLDIRVDEHDQTFWNGEAISDEEFDLRLRSGRINEACVKPIS